MSNTLIQIKRSTSSATPATLSIGELAYSYQSNTLFIGNTSGSGVIAIGGAGTSDIANSYAVLVGAAGNAYANLVGSASNTYADGVGTSANAYSTATFLPLTGGTLSGDLVVSANLTVTGTTTYVNTQSLLVSDNIFVLNADLPSGTAPSQDAGMQINRGSSANVFIIWDEDTDHWQFTNDGTTYQNIVGNTDLQTVATSANAYANAVGTAGNAYAVSVGTAGNTYATSVGTSGNAYAVAVGTAGNTYASGVGTSANAYADLVGSAANTNAANASYINTGTLVVARGGTGAGSFTANGVIFGNGTGALQVTAAGTEGQVLQATAAGVPQFGMLDGGSF